MAEFGWSTFYNFVGAIARAARRIDTPSGTYHQTGGALLWPYSRSHRQQSKKRPATTTVRRGKGVVLKITIGTTSTAMIRLDKRKIQRTRASRCLGGFKDAFRWARLFLPIDPSSSGSKILLCSWTRLILLS